MTNPEDRLICEKKYPCSVDDRYDGTALITERLYGGIIQVWYGVIDLTCTAEDGLALMGKSRTKIALDDGRYGFMHVLTAHAEEIEPAGAALLGEDAGALCLCWFIGAGRLDSPENHKNPGATPLRM